MKEALHWSFDSDISSHSLEGSSKGQYYISLAKSGITEDNELIWFEPAIQSKTSHWAAVNLKKITDLDEL